MTIKAFTVESNQKIAIIMGSKKDWTTMQHSAYILNELKLNFHVEIISAHRTPDKLFSFAEKAKSNGFNIIIAGAGGAAHLPGMLASKTLLPVLGVPIQNSILNGIDSLFSILQMPKGIPVGTLAIGKQGAINAALFAAQILSITDISIFNRLLIWRKKQTNDVLNSPDPREK
ncbi:N5-carboxyaminoimidazole ribonucleotide mutase [Candidatus Providencia siddallii]|uniref:N5-carboxyaminoimidazole ribonucleotide mutase n=1 Tax=Candidatus Providencia siddallii TaxID=1715285 RepID=A0A0M6W861_9GAMM|nr:N5-carboxyaminoimidazole ribonucleotide mutase [Candidatus Providencia siddallii]